MENEIIVLREKLKAEGYQLRFYNNEDLTISKKGFKLKAYTVNRNGFLRVELTLCGEFESSVLDDVITFYESYAASRSLEQIDFIADMKIFGSREDFVLVDNVYRKNLKDKRCQWINNLTPALEEEKRKDPLFSYEFLINYRTDLLIKYHKTGSGGALELGFYEDHYTLIIQETREKFTFSSFDELRDIFPDLFLTIYKKNRLKTLFQSSTFYLEKFLKKIGIQSSAIDIEKLLHLLETEHDSDELNIYFSSSEVDDSKIITAGVRGKQFFLFPILDKWISVAEYEPCLFPENEFDSALEKFKTAVFEATISRKTLEKINKVRNAE